MAEAPSAVAAAATITGSSPQRDVNIAGMAIPLLDASAALNSETESGQLSTQLSTRTRTTTDCTAVLLL